jgi:hypothetical protein
LAGQRWHPIAARRASALTWPSIGPVHDNLMRICRIPKDLTFVDKLGCEGRSV